MDPTLPRRRWWTVVIGAVGLASALRVPLLWTPLNSDEGGYLAISRALGHGATPYHSLFVERPQGVLWLFYLWDCASAGLYAETHSDPHYPHL